MQRLSLSRYPDRLTGFLRQHAENTTLIIRQQQQQTNQRQLVVVTSRNSFTTKAGTKYAKLKKGSVRVADSNTSSSSSTTEAVESLTHTTITTTPVSASVIEPFHASTATAAGTLTDVRKAFDWVVIGPYGIQRIDYTTSPIPPKWPLPSPPPPRKNFVRRYFGLVLAMVTLGGGLFIVLNADDSVYDYWKRVEQGDVPVGDGNEDDDDDDDEDDDLDNYDEDQDDWDDQPTTNIKK